LNECEPLAQGARRGAGPVSSSGRKSDGGRGARSIMRVVDGDGAHWSF
jgi:hypothetical protein